MFRIEFIPQSIVSVRLGFIESDKKIRADVHFKGLRKHTQTTIYLWLQMGLLPTQPVRPRSLVETPKLQDFKI